MEALISIFTSPELLGTLPQALFFFQKNVLHLVDRLDRQVSKHHTGDQSDPASHLVLENIQKVQSEQSQKLESTNLQVDIFRENVTMAEQPNTSQTDL